MMLCGLIFNLHASNSGCIEDALSLAGGSSAAGAAGGQADFNSFLAR
jgi:hypothetical protein